MTNADRIRAASDEVLAELFFEADSRAYSAPLERWLEWMKQTPEEDEHDQSRSD